MAKTTKEAQIRGLVHEFWGVDMGPDKPAPGPLTISPPLQPAGQGRIFGWLLLGSAGFLAWWFLGFKRR